VTPLRLPGFLARVPRSHLVAAAFLLAALLYPVVNPWSPYTQGVALLMFLLAIQAVSWNIISGYAGYTSLGHSMFLGLGSYTVAIIALHTGINPLWIAALGGITAVVSRRWPGSSCCAPGGTRSSSSRSRCCWRPRSWPSTCAR
jgi:ABC-type branched-chain amino acid transport system, permease component